MTEAPAIAAESLRTFAAELLERAGLLAAHARSVAEVLVWADLRGTHSHGVSRLPLYTGWLRSGEMNGASRIECTLLLPALVVLDGQRCAGAPGMLEASDAAIACARRSGIGLALLRDTTHTGALGYFTERIARGGLAAIVMAASGPNMAYHDAAAAGVSTSPLSIAVPRGQPHAPILFDMASSVVALGKLAQAQSAGSSIPAGWALDAQGLPTTDPAEAKIPLPLGGPKGSGLALLFEALCSLLPGNPILQPALSRNADAGPSRHYQNAMVIAIDIAQIIDPDQFAQDVEALVQAIRRLPPAEGREILLPGERGERESQQRRRMGIVLPPGIARQLEGLAADLGVALPWG
jgi:ureidoglycolate dehydrogenase (NAD+)